MAEQNYLTRSDLLVLRGEMLAHKLLINAAFTEILKLHSSAGKLEANLIRLAKVRTSIQQSCKNEFFQRQFFDYSHLPPEEQQIINETLEDTLNTLLANLSP